MFTNMKLFRKFVHSSLIARFVVFNPQAACMQINDVMNLSVLLVNWYLVMHIIVY